MIPTGSSSAVTPAHAAHRRVARHDDRSRSRRTRVVRAVEAKNPKPRYLVGMSGKASVLARLLLTDRMWDRVVMRGLRD